jgi:hypothetical protein
MQHQMLAPGVRKEMPCSTTLIINHGWPEPAHPALSWLDKSWLDKDGLRPR